MRYVVNGKISGEWQETNYHMYNFIGNSGSEQKIVHQEVQIKQPQAWSTSGNVTIILVTCLQ